MILGTKGPWHIFAHLPQGGTGALLPRQKHVRHFHYPHQGSDATGHSATGPKEKQGKLLFGAKVWKHPPGGLQPQKESVNLEETSQPVPPGAGTVEANV